MVLQQCTPGTHPSDLLQLPGLANGARCLLRDYHAITSCLPYQHLGIVQRITPSFCLFMNGLLC